MRKFILDDTRWTIRILTFLFAFSIFNFLLSPPTAYAIVNPLAVPNNKFGIHIIQATPDESSPAAQMVNNNGDWGYITVLIESKDRNHDKWQEFFNDLRRKHLIPLVRLATKPVNEHWERPYEKEYEAWADFLDKLNWPVKNRYVIIYNEPNHGKEWGNSTDPASYAQVLDKTIDALKDKGDDFFVLNAGFDASTPHQPPEYFDEVQFLKEMEKEVPGVLNKLDGWVSHSYPNPGFVGSPNAFGRGTIRTYLWELQLLRSLGVTKNLPVFITETGWKHAEGLNFDPSLPSAEVVADHLKHAFENAWTSDNIVAVTPFLLSYQETPFDHFSFKKLPKTTDENSLPYYPHYYKIRDLPKTKGQPQQENKTLLIKGEIYQSIVAGEVYEIPLTFKNIGQSIWNGVVKLVAKEGGRPFKISDHQIPVDFKVEPGQEYTFMVKLTTPQDDTHKIVLNLYSGQREFDSSPIEFITTIKTPVILKVKTQLKWKNSSDGSYILKIAGVTGETIKTIDLNKKGESVELEARYLLPDYNFTFTLEKPYYKSNQIEKTLHSGINVLDFGALNPDFLSALLNPGQLWKLLPFSNF